MINKFTLVFIIFSFLFTPLVCYGKEDVPALVDRIQQQYNAVQNLKGKFIQKSYISDLEEKREFKGKFLIKMPSRMRWIYKSPRDEEVIINDNVIWIYKKAEKQVIKTTFNVDTYGQAPIALLAGLGNLNQDFQITLFKNNILKLKPIKPMGVIKTILLHLCENKFPVETLTLIDVYDNEVSIHLKEVRINQKLENHDFDFIPPKDTELYEFQ